MVSTCYFWLGLSSAPAILQRLLLLVIAVCLLEPARADWWNPDHEDSIRRLHGRCQEFYKPDGSIDSDWRDFCALSPAELNVAERGARNAIRLCGELMKNEIWNCTTSSWTGFLTKAHKEACFVRTLISSAVAYEFAAACASSVVKNSHCPCDVSEEVTTCKGQLEYGIDMAKKTVDFLVKYELMKKKNPRHKRLVVHQHNHAVGRQAVIRKTAKKCNCAGMSASCTIKVCRKTLPKQQRVLQRVVRLYRKVRFVKGDLSVLKTRLDLLRNQSEGSNAPPMVHSSKRTINYCKEDKARFILGSRGRRCVESTCPKVCCGGTVRLRRPAEKPCFCRYEYHRLICNTCKEAPDELYCA